MSDQARSAASVDVFDRMRAVEERVAELRAQVVRWINDPSEPRIGHTIPASPDDVFWLCSRIERALATIKDGQATYVTIDPDTDPPALLAPMMTERDALVEALYGEA